MITNIIIIHLIIILNFLDSSVLTETKFTCSELGRIEDFLEWLHNGGRFVIDNVCTLFSVNSYIHC